MPHTTTFKGLTIEIDDEGETITVYDNDDAIGVIRLDFAPIDFPYCMDEYYYITELALDKCRRQGVGRECLKFHSETFGFPLVAAKSYGPELADGSHLIDDGLPFIRKMREEGIVCPEPDEVL